MKKLTVIPIVLLMTSACSEKFTSFKSERIESTKSISSNKQVVLTADSNRKTYTQPKQTVKSLPESSTAEFNSMIFRTPF